MLKQRENTRLFGYKDVESEILKEFENNKLHHSLLITGNNGIGKTTFVYRLANKILSDKSKINTGLFGDSFVDNEDLNENDPTFIKIKADSHPDLMSVEIKIDEKTKKPKNYITVDSIREIKDFLNLTPATSKYKIVIINSADDMNIEASNAILKILEEPPKNSFLFLISHNPGRLLDTIRSRCREIKIKPLSYEDWKNAIENSIKNDPSHNILEKDFSILSEISCNSVNIALEFLKHDGIRLYEDFIKLIFNDDIREKIKFADEVSDKDFPFWVFEYITNLFFIRAIKFKSTSKLNSFFNKNEQSTLIKFTNLYSLDSLFEKYLKINEDLKNTNKLNLNKKNVVITVFNYLI